MSLPHKVRGWERTLYEQTPCPPKCTFMIIHSHSFIHSHSQPCTVIHSHAQSFTVFPRLHALSHLHSHLPLHVYSHSLTIMYMHGHQWTSMDIQGHPWTSMDISGVRPQKIKEDQIGPTLAFKVKVLRKIYNY